MPKGPRGEKRPGDVIGAAIMVGRISTGEIIEDITKDKRDPAAVSLGRRGGLKGGNARAKKLSPEKRVAIAKRAAEKRWQKSEK